MAWSRIVTAAIVFIVGVTCSPIDVTVPVTDLVPPQDDGSKLTTVVPTLATDLLPPKIDASSYWNAAPAQLADSDKLPTPATDLLPPSYESVPTPSTDLLPPKFDDESALATDLQPPPLPEKSDQKHAPATLFLINVFAVKNHTAEDSNDVLHTDVMKEVPDEVAEPLALFLLVVEDEDEKSPVSLDEVAKDLEAEGFAVERVRKNGEIQLVKVDLGSVEAPAKLDDKKSNMIESAEEKEESPIEEHGRLSKVRRKRHICLKCKLEELMEKKSHHHGGGYGGGGCNECGGGGYQQRPVQPVQQPIEVYVVEIPGGHKHGGGGGGYYQPPPQQPYYQPPQQHYPPPQPPPQQHYPQPQPQPYCDPCQQQHGGNGGGGGGGGSAYATASAQASASASSGGYGK